MSLAAQSKAHSVYGVFTSEAAQLGCHIYKRALGGWEGDSDLFHSNTKYIPPACAGEDWTDETTGEAKTLKPEKKMISTAIADTRRFLWH
jgi:hypothetical protein